MLRLVQCPAKATKNGGYVGLSHLAAARVATQVVDMSRFEEKWYCRENVASGQSGTHHRSPKLLLFPVLKLVGDAWSLTQRCDVGSGLKAQETPKPAGRRARTPRTAAAKDFSGGGA